MSIVASERPTSFRIGRVFGDSFGVFSRNVVLCVALTALFSGIPTFIYYRWFETQTASDGAETSNFDPANILQYGVVIIGYFVLSAILQSALTRASIEDLNGERPTFADCLATAFAVLWPSIGIAILTTLGVGLGFTLLIVPGIIIWLRWSVATCVLVQERLGVSASMSRSADLTKGSRWALFGLYLIMGIAAIALQAGFEALSFTTTMTSGSTVSIFIDALISAVTTVAFTIASAVSYVELRLVKEGTAVKELAEIFA